MSGLDGYGPLQNSVADAFHEVSVGIHPRTGQPVRVTVFPESTSRHARFRRAFRTDRDVLETLRHHTVPELLDAGEADGRLYLVTTSAVGRSVRELLRLGHVFSTEDVIEIGWQICSALQQAHNLGLTHGAINADTVLLSPDLRVTIVDFGLQRWLSEVRAVPPHATGNREAGPLPGAERANSEAGANFAAHSGSQIGQPAGVRGSEGPRNPFPQQMHADVTDLAELLLQMTEGATGLHESAATGPSGVSRLSLRTLLERVRSADETRLLRARDFQGRLGELLISSGGDSVPLVDQREAAITSRRSIVRELFEPEMSPPAASASPRDRSSQILPIMVAVCLAILLLVIAAWIALTANQAEGASGRVVRVRNIARLSQLRVHELRGAA